jgi:hypothetical protein
MESLGKVINSHLSQSCLSGVMVNVLAIGPNVRGSDLAKMKDF